VVSVAITLLSYASVSVVPVHGTSSIVVVGVRKRIGLSIDLRVAKIVVGEPSRTSSIRICIIIGREATQKTQTLHGLRLGN
ncbi:MAG: hypothetical protein ACI8RD_014775, partial [Bacillariaceae sp.]|jgi:hypothetical protein